LRQNFAHLRTAADHCSLLLIAFSRLPAELKPHNAPDEQQRDNQEKAGAAPGKVVYGIVHDTEHQLYSGDQDVRSYYPRVGAVHISDTGEIHLGTPDTLSLFQPTLIRTLVFRPTQYSGA